jgi:type II secretory pathway component PulM
MNAVLRRIGILFARMNPREQRLISVFAALLLSAGLWNVIIEPVLSGRDGLRSEIGVLQNEVSALALMAERAGTLEQATSTDEAIESDPNFSLLAFIDRVTSSSVSSQSIDAMTPSRRRVDASTEENLVELRLASTSLAEVVDLLESIDDSPNPVFIKQFDLKKRYDDDTRFDVTLVAATMAKS